MNNKIQQVRELMDCNRKQAIKFIELVEKIAEDVYEKELEPPF